MRFGFEFSGGRLLDSLRALVTDVRKPVAHRPRELR